MTSESQRDKGSSEQQGDERQAHLALLHQMAEPLTALGSYFRVASDLLHADTSASRRELVDIISKSEAEIARANAILRRMRDLLRPK